MNREETQALISMAMAMYPATYATPSQIETMVSVWTHELSGVAASEAMEAFRKTAKCFPDRFPSLPKVQETLEAMRANRRDPEKEFRNAHGGKSREEWEAMEKWENSEEGKRKIAWYRERLRAFINEKKTA